MSCEILLISEGIKGEIYAEPGKFESKTEPARLTRGELDIILSLTRGWKFKSEIPPTDGTGNIVKYIHRINKKLPGLIINNRAKQYRLNPYLIITRSPAQ